MDRSEFFRPDGSINMNTAEIAARRARAQAAVTGASRIFRIFRPENPGIATNRR